MKNINKKIWIVLGIILSVCFIFIGTLTVIINGDKIDDINEMTKEMSFRKLNNMIMTIEEARKNIKSNVSWAMILRVMLMGFMEG